MSSYTHRERVLAALNHQEPDRVPIDMMGNATMLLDSTYLALRDHLGLPPIPPVRSGTSANYYDERILDYFDVDFRRLFLKEKKHGGGRDPSGLWADAWGVQYKQDGLYVNVISSPLASCASVADVEAHAWPSAESMFSTDGLAEEAERMYRETDYALVARNPMSAGFLDRCCQLMGMSEFMMTLAAAPDVAHCVLAHLLEIYKGVYSMFLDAVGPYVQMVEAADDLGSQNSLLISEAMYREFFKPADAELYQLIRRKAPNAVIFRHTDGAIFSLIRDLMSVGVGVLNPVQTSARGMDGRALKNEFGNALTFHGAIETTGVSVDELVAEVKEKLSILAPGGGYVLASCNHLVEVPPENVVAMLETARDFGRYDRMGGVPK